MFLNNKNYFKYLGKYLQNLINYKTKEKIRKFFVNSLIKYYNCI